MGKPLMSKSYSTITTNDLAWTLSTLANGIATVTCLTRSVLTYDMTDKKETIFIRDGGIYGGEALYVPKANAGSEDDRYLLGFLVTEEMLDVIVVDASTMNEAARLHPPQCVLLDFHATWLRSDEAASRI